MTPLIPNNSIPLFRYDPNNFQTFAEYFGNARIYINGMLWKWPKEIYIEREKS
jgi:hypothetical protein